MHWGHLGSDCTSSGWGTPKKCLLSGSHAPVSMICPGSIPSPWPGAPRLIAPSLIRVCPRCPPSHTSLRVGTYLNTVLLQRGAAMHACTAMTTPLPGQLFSGVPSCSCSSGFSPAHRFFHSLSLWQTLLEVVKEEASSATPSSGNQHTRPSSSILPCKCCDTFHSLPSRTCV